MAYETLFSPWTIGDVEMKNRVVMSSMGVGLADPDGKINDKVIAYISERAKGGVGLIMTEYTRVNEADGVASPGQFSLATDDHVPGMKRLVDTAHSEGAKVFVQLHHPGRQSISLYPTLWPLMEHIAKIYPNLFDRYFDLVNFIVRPGVDIMGLDPNLMKAIMSPLVPLRTPSKLPWNEKDIALNYVKYRAFKEREIHELVDQFIAGAVRAKKAGADGVELHSAHGYLLQQFLSDFTNRRTDAYGGSRENRARVIKEIIQGIKKNCGQNFPVTVRLTADEMRQVVGHPENGYHLDEAIEIAKLLVGYGADGINVSLGSSEALETVVESTRYPLGWKNNLIKGIKDAVDIPVYGASSIRTPDQAEGYLAEGLMDAVVLGRPLLADPSWAKKAQDGKSETIQRCIGCMRCWETFNANMVNEKPIECSVNPRTCRESLIPEKPARDGNARKVAVVGAGVAGLSAAKQLALRGFEVTVFEKEEEPGGQLNLAKKPPYKERIIWAAQDLAAQVKDLGVEIRYGQKATVDVLREMKPYATLIATGGFAVHPKIPGADADYVQTVTPYLQGKITPEGEEIVVVGSGMTGLETSEMLTDHGNHVTVVEMAKKIAPGASSTNTGEILPELKKRDVHFLPGHKLEKIENHYVYLTNQNGAGKKLHADRVVLSLGVRPDQALFESLKGTVPNLYLVGDAQKVGRVVTAVMDGFKTARTI